MYKPTMWAVLSLSLAAVPAVGQSNLSAKANTVLTKSGSAIVETDRIRDGYAGPVRRVRTEVAKLSTVAGKLEEGKRVLLETAEYDVSGAKTQNQYFPVSGSLTGREVYKYDEKGNISEMTLLNTDGSLLSKEVYNYEFDSIGNWVKMNTSVAIVENGKIAFEPTEITYRTIFYYLDASMAKMLQPATGPSSVPAKTDQPKPSNASAAVENRVLAPLPPKVSLDKLKLAGIQAPPGDVAALLVNTNKPVLPVDAEPPPAPRTILKPMSGGVLNAKALNLPAPIYPETARRVRAAGTVEVEVVIDENGKVISARAISGLAILRDVSVQAASRARFSPTKLSGQPMKVVGKIIYNFILP